MGKDEEGMAVKDQIGAEKVKFVKWLMKKGVSLREAKLIAYKKFYHGIPNDWKVDKSNSSLKKIRINFQGNI